MSLDVSLNLSHAVQCRGTGVFVREDGRQKELTSEEVAKRFPGSAVAEQEYETTCVYDGNITHNLGRMALEAGIYLALWRPGQMLAPDINAAIEVQQEQDNYHGNGGVYELERMLPEVHASDLINPLAEGLKKLEDDPAHYKQFDSPNGWGLYEHFVPFVRDYLAACREYPEATVKVSK